MKALRGISCALLLTASPAFAADDAMATVAALDTQYQLAVKNNDAATMAKILADDFILVTGRGKVFDKKDLLADANAKQTQYEHQEDSQQTVRVFGDTAVVTALLYVKSTGKDAREYKLWFSDVYVRQAQGWRYVFGQAAQPLQP